jgi:hypothetical protein
MELVTGYLFGSIKKLIQFCMENLVRRNFLDVGIDGLIILKLASDK